MKVANIFATLPLRGNYEVIADYILNRVGAVGLAWGAYSQKAVSIATGCNRLGIPVVLGPHSAKYRRLFVSKKGEDDWGQWELLTFSGFSYSILAVPSLWRQFRLVDD